MSRVLIVAADREGRPRRVLRDLVKLPHAYDWSVRLPNGEYRRGRVYAWNKSDADVAARKQFRERHPVDEAGCWWFHGVERVK